MAVIAVALGCAGLQRCLPRPAELGMWGTLAYLGVAGTGLLLAYTVVLWLVGEKDMVEYLLVKARLIKAARN
jgi:hypothetical protein